MRLVLGLLGKRFLRRGGKPGTEHRGERTCPHPVLLATPVDDGGNPWPGIAGNEKRADSLRAVEFMRRQAEQIDASGRHIDR